MKKQAAACKYCGSENLIFDACSRWNKEKQEYELIDTYASRPYCPDCDQEGWPDWQDIATDESRSNGPHQTTK